MGQPARRAARDLVTAAGFQSQLDERGGLPFWSRDMCRDARRVSGLHLRR